ncbi:uncharacterized protein [Amphiura filiformis]|uniref:uncharacterized protein n=1 Tax=Amphiura filiformis TaxID=82378 RepID=UPI003B2247B9
MQRMDFYKKCSLMVIVLSIMMAADCVLVGSSISLGSVPLDSALLCQSRCLAKCFAEHNSTDQCEHCDVYNGDWMTHNCSSSDCQNSCDNLVQNETGSLPSTPKLEMSQGTRTLVFSWDTQEPQAVYVLLQRQSESWRLLHKTTDNAYELRDLASPPCEDVVTQICLVAVNMFGQSPRSNVILIGKYLYS